MILYNFWITLQFSLTLIHNKLHTVFHRIINVIISLIAQITWHLLADNVVRAECLLTIIFQTIEALTWKSIFPWNTRLSNSSITVTCAIQESCVKRDTILQIRTASCISLSEAFLLFSTSIHVSYSSHNCYYCYTCYMYSLCANCHFMFFCYCVISQLLNIAIQKVLSVEVFIYDSYTIRHRHQEFTG